MTTTASIELLIPRTPWDCRDVDEVLHDAFPGWDHYGECLGRSEFCAVGGTAAGAGEREDLLQTLIQALPRLFGIVGHGHQVEVWLGSESLIITEDRIETADLRALLASPEETDGLAAAA